MLLLNKLTFTVYLISYYCSLLNKKGDNIFCGKIARIICLELVCQNNANHLFFGCMIIIMLCSEGNPSCITLSNNFLHPVIVCCSASSGVSTGVCSLHMKYFQLSWRQHLHLLFSLHQLAMYQPIDT